MTHAQLLEQIAEYISNIRLSHPLRVAIDGIDAAGKTTLANALAPVLERRKRMVIRASIDGFHNPKAIRHARGSLSPEGYYYDSFNYTALKNLLLVPLGEGGNREYRTAIFDFRTDSPVQSSQCLAPTDAILIFEGVFLFRPEIGNLWDVKIFLDISFGESISRASQRDQYLFGNIEVVRERYLQRYVPGQQLYFETCHPAEQAHILIDNNNVDNAVLLRCIPWETVAQH